MASNTTQPDSPSAASNDQPLQREDPEGAAGAAASSASAAVASTGPPPDLTSDTPPDVLDGTTSADARGSTFRPFFGRPSIKEGSSVDREEPATKTEASTGPFRFTGFLESMTKDAEIRYRMDHKKRGIAVIFSHEEFHWKTGMPKRTGNAKDVENLKKYLGKMGFEIMLFQDLTVEELKRTIGMAAMGTDHSDSDCFMCIFLTHGDDGVVYGHDGTLPIQVFYDIFRGENCPSLVGKPKIFLIQACRGEKHEIGVEPLETDAEDEPDSGLIVQDAGPKPTIPAGADFLICYSVTQGFYSHRDTAYGSWYVQALCHALDTYGTSLEFTHLLTIVNRTVANRAVERCLQASMIGKKQIPCFMSMLTKQLYFTPKPSVQKKK
ncbi:caspase-6-like [Amphiura filiformis]|uniref:caspase-6-like n=1 Tax=Amphiura filiformis TaxID=82378 RepID=UPI003B21FDB9